MSSILSGPRAPRTCRVSGRRAWTASRTLAGSGDDALVRVEVVLQLVDEVVVAVHAVPAVLSSRASASRAARRCFRA